MSRTTHTPGPWKADTIYNSNGGTSFEVLDSEGFPVLRIRGGMIPVDANARLIAAAPELLAALRWAAETLWVAVATVEDDGSPRIGMREKLALIGKMARAGAYKIENAIRKAEGGAA